MLLFDRDTLVGRGQPDFHAGVGDEADGDSGGHRGQGNPRLAARGRRVLALDVRGRGQSAWDPEPARYQPATYAGDVLALMDAAGIARACFIGPSMGGLITSAAEGVSCSTPSCWVQ